MRLTQQTSSKPTAGHPPVDKTELRILRRLCETGAFLVVSDGLSRAVVMRRAASGEETRTAVVEASVVGALAIKDWISCTRKAKLMFYEVTTAGRAALKRMLAQDAARRANATGFAETSTPFAEQHKEWGQRKIADPTDGKPRKMRVNLRESPLTTLARKKGPDGNPFLSPQLLDAGERLREDFELSQIGPRVTQNWERFLTAGDRGNFGSGEGGGSAAQKRFAEALTALGPGLGDIALRCCCFLEGLETAEKRMGWSARSGKVVLRIALTRLAMHYHENVPASSRKIG